MPLLEKGQWRADLCSLAEMDNFPTQITAESHRYHFYYAYGCPFAHRANLVIHYLDLHHVISSSSTAPEMLDQGWTFNEQYPDSLFHSAFLRDIYLKAKPDYSGRVSLPVLWDKQAQTIACNDSAEMALHLATEWQDFAQKPATLVPEALKEEISRLNEWLNLQITLKVYQVGLANSQQKYEKQLAKLFENLETLDDRLAQTRYLFGETITLSDFFLFPTLIRFESVYADLYKCNLKPLSEFKHLYRYMIDLYQQPAIQATVDIPYTKRFYYFSQPHLNPTRLVPVGPNLKWR
ncbi:glutathione-dependent reductase [Neisseria weixii]|uniref:Glutathione-dependent reductase n=1 Tax=Neisseria weixii TaxID=1853276 RepID=A0A3N4MLK4_9NEIS|nr:glutathione S-transferase C-terminal domain-containing protein [Neisseria weixii]RPD83955.1 glutathione-dependent reductase [Neisseria weixii]RPD84328.1 glutathione-dependent reductase [Neisseria weixii]